jgi:hypothetical protein
MNKLEILLKKWKAGSITDPNLSLCLSYINSIQLEKRNEREPSTIQRTDPVPGEDDNPKLKRLKTKGL